MIVPHGQTTVKSAQTGDWRCMGCNDLQFAKNPTCRKCGEAKPQTSDLQMALAAKNELAVVALTPQESPIIQAMCTGEDWACPLCKEVSFANRTTCRRCGCPRPEGAVVVNTVQHQLANGGYIGYLPDVSKVEATSSWAKQFDAGPQPGIMCGYGAMSAAPQNFDPKLDYGSSSSSSDSDDSSDSSDSSDEAPKKKKIKADAKKKKASSSGSSSDDDKKTKKEKASKKSETKADEPVVDDAEKKAKEEAEAAKKAKKEAKALEKAKLEKEKAKQKKKAKKAMDVDEELEKRRLQTERRKSRIVNLAL